MADKLDWTRIRAERDRQAALSARELLAKYAQPGAPRSGEQKEVDVITMATELYRQRHLPRIEDVTGGTGDPLIVTVDWRGTPPEQKDWDSGVAEARVIEALAAAGWAPRICWMASSHSDENGHGDADVFTLAWTHPAMEPPLRQGLSPTDSGPSDDEDE
jgi:hypothetical protein